MAFGENQDPNVGKATQFPHNDPTKGGRKRSIRKQLNLLLEGNGSLVVPKSQVIKIDKETGDVTIRVPTDLQLALKLKSMALGKNGPNTLNALKLMFENTDGKMVQPIALVEPEQPYRSPEQIEDRIKELERKLNGETD